MRLNERNTAAHPTPTRSGTGSRALARVLTGEVPAGLVCHFDVPAGVTATIPLGTAVASELGSPALDSASLTTARGLDRRELARRGCLRVPDHRGRLRRDVSGHPHPGHGSPAPRRPKDRSTSARQPDIAASRPCARLQRFSDAGGCRRTSPVGFEVPPSAANRLRDKSRGWVSGTEIPNLGTETAADATLSRDRRRDPTETHGAAEVRRPPRRGLVDSQ